MDIYDKQTMRYMDMFCSFVMVPMQICTCKVYFMASRVPSVVHILFLISIPRFLSASHKLGS